MSANIFLLLQISLVNFTGSPKFDVFNLAGADDEVAGILFTVGLAYAVLGLL